MATSDGRNIRQALAAFVDRVGSQAMAARALKVSRSHVNHLLAGRKEFGSELALRLGFRRVVTYRKNRNVQRAIASE